MRVFCSFLLIEAVILLSGCSVINKMFTAKPSVPRVLFPKDGASDVEIFPKLRWVGSNAKKYYIYLGEKRNLNALNLIAERAGFEYETGALAPGKTYYWKIEADNEGGSVSSSVVSFTTVSDLRCYFPSEPTCTLQDLSSEGLMYRATLAWVSDRSETYDLYFGMDPDPGIFLSNLLQNQVLIDGLAPNQQYYWRIVAINEFDRTEGDTCVFKTDALFMDAPQALFPLSPSEENALSIRFQWSPALCPYGSQVYYALYVGETRSLTEADIVVSNLTGTEYILNALSGSTDYYWMVRAESAYAAAVSSVFHFSTKEPSPEDLPTLPENPAPGNFAFYQKTALALTWDCQNYENFELWLGINSLNLSLIEAALDVPAYFADNLPYDARCYWKAVARNSLGVTEGPVWEFHTERDSPTQPAPVFPKNASKDNYRALMLHWTESECPSGDPIYYDLYCGTSTVLEEEHVLGEGFAQNSYSLSGLQSDSQYFWKVVAKNVREETESPVFSFWTGDEENEDPPATPSSPSPADRAVGLPENPLLSWESSGAEYFSVFTGTSETELSEVEKDYIYSALRLTNLSANTTYYWRIIGYNAFGNSMGPIWRFTTSSEVLEKPQAVYPTSNSVNCELSLTLRWSEAKASDRDPVSYQVRMSEDNQLSDNTIIAQDLGQTSFNVVNLKPNTRYYWRVIASNSEGYVESNIFYFTTRSPNDSDRPAVPTNPTPANGSIGQSRPLTLRWDCSRADSYTLFMSEYQDFSSLIQFSTDQTHFFIEGLKANTWYYWRVVATNEYGSSEGTIWRFRTQNEGSKKPAVTQADLSLPYNADNKVARGTGAQLKVAIRFEDDYQLKSANLKIFFKKQTEPDWVLLKTEEKDLSPYTTFAEWTFYHILISAKGSSFYDLGKYRIYFEVTVMDSENQTSDVFRSDELEMEVFWDRPPVTPGIEGTWYANFSIAYIVYMNGEITMEVTKTSETDFSVSVTYNGKSYSGTGTLTNNKDIRITSRVEGVQAILTGILISDTTVSGSIFIVEGDQPNKIGTWEAMK